MTGTHAKYPEVVFLRRPDSTGYGFFFYNEADFGHAVNSFAQPILALSPASRCPASPTPRII